MDSLSNRLKSSFKEEKSMVQIFEELNKEIKMNKLELKDLAPYLPYGLSCHAMGESIEGKPILFTLMGLSDDLLNHKHAELWSGENEDGTTEDIITMALDDTFPLLRPMSDLTKEITHNGETFVPSLKLGIHHAKSHIKEFPKEFAIEKGCNVKYKTKGFYYYTFLTYFETQKLFEWHFDIFGLIERGLAINLNEVDNGK